MGDLARRCLIALDAIDGEWKVERLLDMPDAFMLARRQHLGWISHRDPADRYGFSRGEMGLEVHHSVDAHLAALSEARSVKHGSAGGNEDLILKSTADDMSVRADEAVVGNAQRMARGTSENSVLHDDALAADTYRSSLGDHLSSEHDAAARTDPDIATDHSIRSDPGGGVYSWRGAIVFDDHVTPQRFGRWRLS